MWKKDVETDNGALSSHRHRFERIWIVWLIKCDAETRTHTLCLRTMNLYHCVLFAGIRFFGIRSRTIVALCRKKNWLCQPWTKNSRPRKWWNVERTSLVGINISSYFKVASKQPSTSSSSAPLFRLTIPLLDFISRLSWHFLLDVIEFDSILNIHVLFMVLIEFFSLSSVLCNLKYTSLVSSSNQLLTMNVFSLSLSRPFPSSIFTRIFFHFNAFVQFANKVAVIILKFKLFSFAQWTVRIRDS